MSSSHRPQALRARRIRRASFALAFVLSACGGQAPPLPSVSANVPASSPRVADAAEPAGRGGADVEQTNGFGRWQVFGAADEGSYVGGIAVGPNGRDLWFIADQAGIFDVRMDGVVTLHPLSFTTGGALQPVGLALGADGRFYMPSAVVFNGQFVGAFDPATGKVDVYSLPADDTYEGGGIARGSDGNVWLTELAHVAKIAHNGTITEYVYPSGARSNAFAGVAAGGDGMVWFAEHNDQIAPPPGKGFVDKLDPSTGKIVSYDVSNLCPDPGDVARGAGDTIVATCGTSPSSLLTIATDGSGAAAYRDPYGKSLGTGQIALGPDGAYYVSTFVQKNELARFDPATKTFGKVAPPPPFEGFGFGPLVVGPDGNLWAIDLFGSIYVDVFNEISVAPRTLSLGAGATAMLRATYRGTKPRPLAARTLDATVATVAAGATAGTFVVTARARGATQVVVHDPLRNSFAVAVNVR